MDKLTVVNMLLRSIGSSPVNSLSTSVGGTNSAHPDVAAALAVMDRVRRTKQKKSWWFNSDYNVTLVRDSAGQIKIPSHVVSVDVDYTGYVVRGKKLYDSYNNTYKFDVDVLAKELTVALDWDDMPESFQEYCAYSAMAQYIRDELEDQAKEKSAETEAARCLIDIKQIDLRMNDYNIFNRPRVMQGMYPRTGPVSKYFGVPIP